MDKEHEIYRDIAMDIASDIAKAWKRANPHLHEKADKDEGVVALELKGEYVEEMDSLKEELMNGEYVEEMDSLKEELMNGEYVEEMDSLKEELMNGEYVEEMDSLKEESMNEQLGEGLLNWQEQGKQTKFVELSHGEAITNGQIIIPKLKQEPNLDINQLTEARENENGEIKMKVSSVVLMEGRRCHLVIILFAGSQMEENYTSLLYYRSQTLMWEPSPLSYSVRTVVCTE